MNGIRNDASSIMISLQVQDITAQQLAAVNHMLFTIQDKLGGILKHFQNTDLTSIPGNDNPFNDTMNISMMHREIAFDPIAVDALAKDGNRQENVDDLINAHLSGNIDINATSEDESFDSNDIDAMFNGQIAETIESNAPISIPSITLTEEENEDDEIDIDALFSTAAQNNATTTNDNVNNITLDGDLDEPIDPNDLDALFASNNTDSDLDNSSNSDDNQSSDTEDIDKTAENDVLSNLDDVEDDSQFSQDDIDAMFGNL